MRICSFSSIHLVEEYGPAATSPRAPLVGGISRRSGQARGGVGFDPTQTAGFQFPRRLEHGVGNRANMRMNAFEIAQHVEMQRGRLQALGPALAQPPRWLSAAASSSERSSAFSSISLRATLTSPDMKTPKASLRFSMTR